MNPPPNHTLSFQLPDKSRFLILDLDTPGGRAVIGMTPLGAAMEQAERALAEQHLAGKPAQGVSIDLRQSPIPSALLYARLGLPGARDAGWLCAIASAPDTMSAVALDVLFNTSYLGAEPRVDGFRSLSVSDPRRWFEDVRRLADQLDQDAKAKGLPALDWPALSTHLEQ